MIVKKILNCLRALVVLLAITMGFTIAITFSRSQRATRVQPVSVDLDQINTKLDRMIEEGRARDTVLLQQILKLQQRGNQVPDGRIVEVFKD